MPNFSPESFIDALAGVVLILALILSLLSLVPSIRAHCIKLMAIFSVAALTLFSHHWSTYFAGIFVIATAVTELEFLQNLAAIIRGNKDYFDYKKETLSLEQRKQKIQEEMVEIPDIVDEAANDSGSVNPDLKSSGLSPVSGLKPKSELSEISSTQFSRIPPDNQDTNSTSKIIRRALMVEEAVIDRTEKLLKSNVERGVRLSGNGAILELDGMFEKERKNSLYDKAIEIKYFTHSGVRSFPSILKKLERMKNDYNAITGRYLDLYLALVIEGDMGFSGEQQKLLKRLIGSSNVIKEYKVYTTAELGL